MTVKAIFGSITKGKHANLHWQNLAESRGGHAHLRFENHVHELVFAYSTF
jgi:hypothetical protein